MIVLTGASGGIGSAIRRGLMDLDTLYSIYNHTHIDHYNPTEYAIKLDITNLNEIKENLKNLNLTKITLIHLAAVKIDELAVFVNEDNWDKVFDVNIKGAFFLTQTLLKKMMEERWGRIIFVVSSGLGDRGTTTYSASKYALLGLSEVLSREYSKFGITTNVLQLGYFKTGLWEKLSEPKKDELLNQIPSKKLGEPQNIVNAIKFVIDSPFVNGAVLSIDGGI